MGQNLDQNATNTAGDTDLNGQIDEVRLWAGPRTEAQIRDNMCRPLTGNEAGLLGLWNFENVTNGVVKDASPGHHDGQFVGNARVVAAVLPSAGVLIPWSRLVLNITDDAGAPLPNVAIRAQVHDSEVAGGSSDSLGKVSLTIWTGASAVDLFAAGANGLEGWQLGVPITHYAALANTWKLGPPIHLGGRVVALDGKTPLPNVAVELVQPAGAEAESGGRRREAAPSPSENPKSEIRNPNSSQSLHGSAAANRVLQLDGQCYFALPKNIVAGLSAATIEGWIKWDKLLPYADLFDFGGQNGEMFVKTGNPEGANSADLTAVFDVGYPPVQRINLHVPDILRKNQWFHLALVTGPGGMRLFVNGELMATTNYTGSFAAIPNFIDYDQNLVGARHKFPAHERPGGRILYLENRAHSRTDSLGHAHPADGPRTRIDWPVEFR